MTSPSTLALVLLALAIGFSAVTGTNESCCKRCTSYYIEGNSSQFVQGSNMFSVVPGDTITRPGYTASFNGVFNIRGSAPGAYLGLYTNTGGNVLYQAAEIRFSDTTKVEFSGDAPGDIPVGVPFVAAITSGTGKYKDATGTAVQTNVGPGLTLNIKLIFKACLDD